MQGEQSGVGGGPALVEQTTGEEGEDGHTDEVEAERGCGGELVGEEEGKAKKGGGSDPQASKVSEEKSPALPCLAW